MGWFSDITDGIGLTDSGAADRGISAQTDAMNKANAILEKNYGEAKERYQPWQEKGKEAFLSLSNMANNNEKFSDQGRFKGHSGVFSDADGEFKGHSGVFSMDDFKKDPGYAFRESEGRKNLERSAAARGGFGGGATMKALARYGQNFASNEYDKAYNRFNQDYSNSYNRYNQDYGNSYNRYTNQKNNRFNNLNQIANYGSNANNAITSAGTNNANSIANNQVGLGNSIANAELHRGDEMKGLWKMAAQGAAAYAGS